MSILFSGDFHGGAASELTTITKKTLKRKYGLDKFSEIKYHIILGDGAFMWPNSKKTDLFNYNVLAYRPFSILCVLGNHEPIYGMKNVPEVDIGLGEKVYQIHDKPFTAYLKRGKIYTIEGFKMLVLGGALSIDKDARKRNKTWWEQEYWSEQEKEDLFKLLETDNSFDCVLSHTGPEHVNKTLYNYRASPHSFRIINKVALLNDEIHKQIRFRAWWCGHWHREASFYNPETKQEYWYLYRKTKILDRVSGQMEVYHENENPIM